MHILEMGERYVYDPRNKKVYDAELFLAYDEQTGLWVAYIILIEEGGEEKRYTVGFDSAAPHGRTGFYIRTDLQKD